MRSAIAILMILAVAGTSAAQDLGSSKERPVKDTPTQTYVSPGGARQGGDTIADAVVIPGIPYVVSGTTDGFTDDYDEVCPYTGSTSPDVVYSFTPWGDTAISIDLCGSSYDTKVYVYDSNTNLMACNDDYYFEEFCGIYVSYIDSVYLMAGQTYYIIIDGYGGDAGAYELEVGDTWLCFLECSPDAVDEGEPELHDGYVDTWNGGCSDPGLSFTEINWTNDQDGYPPYDGFAYLCGTSGWYIGPNGSDSRDTDWFRVYALETGTMDFIVEPEYRCYLFKLAPLDCGEVAVELQTVGECYAPGVLSFPVTAGEEVWLWVGPIDFTGPVTEFTYTMAVTNNTFDVVPVEDKSWGGVKALYR